MSITVNTNNAATKAAFNLSKASDDLRKSLARLSSGNRIVNSNDDPGGMSVAYKLDSRLRRTEAVRHNVQMQFLTSRYRMVPYNLQVILFPVCPNFVQWHRM